MYSSILDRPHPVLRHYFLASGVSLLFAFWLFPVDFILGEGTHWAAPGGDLLQNVIGMRYFLADDWRFPLFQTQLIAPPEGISIVYTDSLPIFALIAKLLRSFLPEQVNYFGIWYFVSYTLQPIAAVFLLRSMGTKALFPNLAITIIAVSFPPFLHRVGHAALCGHFLVIFALGLYFRSVRQRAFGSVWPWFALLCGLSLFVHAYLFIMVFGIFLATATQEATPSRSGLQRSLAAATVVVGSTALLMWVSGYFHGVTETGGFGRYSMDVLSPWVPQRSGLFLAMDHIIDRPGGKQEGFNYLGIGILLLLVSGLWSSWSEISRALYRYWALSLLLLGLTLLAISHRVFVGEWEVLQFGTNISSLYFSFAALLVLAAMLWSSRSQLFFALRKHWRPALVLLGLSLLAIVTFAFTGWEVLKLLLLQFRSSGRFFWPVGYILMGTGLVMALKLRRPFNIALITAAAVLQFVDAGPLRNRVAASVRSGMQFSLHAEPWSEIIGAHERLTIVPSYYCAGSFNRRVLDLVFHASSTATPVNTMYLARKPKTVECAQEVLSLGARELGQGELLVLLSPPLSESDLSQMPQFAHLCHPFVGGFACSRLSFVVE